MTAKKTTTTAGADLSDKEIADAKKEGALDYVKEGASRAMAADTGTTGDPEAYADAEAKRVPADANTTFMAPLLDLSVEELERRLTDDNAPDKIAQDDAKPLLALERAGQNRTPFVKMLCKVIGVKSPYEVTHAGPDYTNDVTSVTKL